ncbi:putative secretin GspD [subsurface metagenome]
MEKPQVVVIESTNSLLVNATNEQHAQLTTIIGYVDSKMEAEEIPYQLYPLENQSPEHLAEVLQNLIKQTVQDKEGKVERVVKSGEDIVIVPDENTFSLIVYASKKNQEWISNLIEKLDKRRPQVLIDVTLVEVSRTDLFDLDLDLVSKFPRFEAGGEMDFLEELLKPFPSKRIIELTSDSGIGTGFYSDRHIQALLTAMQTKSYGRVLAKPKILVNDGQPGTIQTTEKTNVKLEEFISGGPDKPDRTVPRWEPYTAGIMLTITPNISEGDLLLLNVKLTRSDFGEVPAEGSPPDITESDIETTVTVPDGRTIILGGLLKLNQVKGGTKVPILGDIPGIGGLFRSTSNTDRETKLYVFVKANILRPDEAVAGLPELEKISERNRTAFEEFEERFQKYQDWPGIPPQPMNPPKVLEAE